MNLWLLHNYLATQNIVRIFTGNLKLKVMNKFERIQFIFIGLCATYFALRTLFTFI